VYLCYGRSYTVRFFNEPSLRHVHVAFCVRFIKLGFIRRIPVSEFAVFRAIDVGFLIPRRNVAFPSALARSIIGWLSFRAFLRNNETHGRSRDFWVTSRFPLATTDWFSAGKQRAVFKKRDDQHFHSRRPTVPINLHIYIYIYIFRLYLFFTLARNSRAARRLTIFY